MDIIVCVKITPDPADIEERPDGGISLERAEWAINVFDLQAVEAAVRLVEAGGGKVTTLSAGPKAIDNSKLKKDLLSRGPDELVMIADDALRGADTAATAQVLVEAAHKIGRFDLLLFGEGSADLYFQQVGLQVGERLGLPALNAIDQIERSGDRLLVERSLEDAVEVLEVPLPAALSVTTDINPPRLPTMKEILKAGKKPAAVWSLGDLGLPGAPLPQVEVISVQAPPKRERKNMLLDGTPEEAARRLVESLAREGLV